ncbi:CoA transferase [Nocardioidaceae bacterium]|nr:CoA transferase [Nocardioidaceae bacterium]
MSIELGRGTGPLAGIKVVEIAGIGPGPHACMLLADLGADVIRVERPGGAMSVTSREGDLLLRGRPSVALDLKHPRALETVLELVDDADVLIEGMRPGAAERMGIGPDACLGRNPRLVYGRMTGWGQDGPWAQMAGHDMNYIGLTGILDGLGQDRGRPHFPANLLGDFGGGSLYLVVGVLAALLEAQRSGEGQVVDAAIVDGTAHLAAMTVAQLVEGALTEKRGRGLLDGGAPFYDVYATSDGRHMSVGPLEPQFFAEFARLLELPDDAPGQFELERWGELRETLTRRFAERTQAEWAGVFDGTDACVAPVLRFGEAVDHPHLTARGVYAPHEGLRQPAPAPRFSRTQASLTRNPGAVGADTLAALRAWGVESPEQLVAEGAAHQA